MISTQKPLFDTITILPQRRVVSWAAVPPGRPSLSSTRVCAELEASGDHLQLIPVATGGQPHSLFYSHWSELLTRV